MPTPTDERDSIDPQTSTQLEKLQLEVLELRWRVRCVYKLAQATSIVLALLAVVGFVWNLHQFNYQQAVSAKAANDAKEKETKAAEREQKKPLFERQLAIYLEISDLAGAIATLPEDDPGRKKAEDRFRQLFYGPAIFVEETADMKKGLIEFSNCLDGLPGCETEEKRGYRLKFLSKYLTNLCRGALGLTWEVPQDNLYQNDYQLSLDEIEATKVKVEASK